ncbi:glycosyltransferase family 2 protein [Motilibacter deserti]|uniref:Glycosyltransferase n=1 Tax=Motilibacter deserti TaxID=2714956 RepID=A0ABX0GX65_9ACTN|nr:glycosyltransferase [Motilibacter deserti]NHC15158.1 glycosyltransferase [Motilibacter deserti]
MGPLIGCVVLTQGKRPLELKEAVESLLRQTGVRLDVLVVGNGWEPDGLPPEVRTLALPRNLGIPAGRNAGGRAVEGELVVFLDDDASLPDSGTLAEAVARFEADPGLGLVQFHPVDPDGLPTPRRWIPRLRVGDEDRSSDVCAVWEGAVMCRREAFDRSGGWPEAFYYMHEGIDFAWRTWDAGFSVRYDGDLIAYHSARVGPGRHPGFTRYSVRNRVWIARRNLPAPLAVAYLGTWSLLTLVRLRSFPELREVLRGYLEGFREPVVDRRPMHWATAWRMTRAGRPPIV